MSEDIETVLMRFQIKRMVFEKPSDFRLEVQVENSTKRDIQFMDFDSLACFEHYHLKIDLKKTDGSAITRSIPKCVSEPFPGKLITIPAGKNLTKIFDEKAFLPDASLENGSYKVSIGPKYPHFEKAESIDTAILNIDMFHIRPAVEQFSVSLNDTKNLTGGLKIKFLGHSHKRTYPGQESPLIVSLEMSQDTLMEKAGYSVYPTENPFFVWKGHVFELVSHKYNESMNLKYYGQIPALLKANAQ